MRTLHSTSVNMLLHQQTMFDSLKIKLYSKRIILFWPTNRFIVARKTFLPIFVANRGRWTSGATRSKSKRRSTTRRLVSRRSRDDSTRGRRRRCDQRAPRREGIHRQALKHHASEVEAGAVETQSNSLASSVLLRLSAAGARSSTLVSSVIPKLCAEGSVERYR